MSNESSAKTNASAWTAVHIGETGMFLGEPSREVWALIEGGCEIATGPRERIELMAAAPALAEAARALAPMFDNDSPLLAVYATEIAALRAALALAGAKS
jgi:hypothetical protein